MKKRNSFIILCAVLSMGMLLGACNEKQPAGESQNPGESESQSGSEVVGTYTVTFDSNGGSSVASQTVKKGEKVKKPTDPTKEGFTFGNWFEDKVLATQYDFNTPVTSNFTLYASWTKNTQPPEPPTPQDYDFYVAIAGTSQGMTPNEGASMLDNQTGEYVATFAIVSKNDTVAFTDTNKDRLTNIGPESGDNNCFASEGIFYIHNDATSINVYLKTWSDGGFSFWITGYEADTPIETHTYAVQIGGEDYALAVNTAATLADGQTAEYYAEIASVTAGDVIHFYIDNNLVASNIGPDSGSNNCIISDFLFVIHNDATNVTVYFKIWSDGGYSFWITGYEAGTPSSEHHGPEGSTLVSWYLVGHGSLWRYSSWSIDDSIQLYSNPNSTTDKGCILSVTFAENDLFKVTDGTTWFGYEKIDPYVSDDNYGLKNFIGDPDGFNGENIKCTVAGTYDIYVNASGTFWITNYQA